MILNLEVSRGQKINILVPAFYGRFSTKTKNVSSAIPHKGKIQAFYKKTCKRTAFEYDVPKNKM